MDGYLEHARQALDDIDSYDIVHVVIGNEACDLDSTVSSLVYAYYLHTVSRDEGRIVYLPVLNIPHSEHKLKLDTTYFLDSNNTKEEHLIFRDEIDLAGLNSRAKLRLTLVDFNIFPKSDQDLEPCIVEILDHHKQEVMEREGLQMDIEMVGSCSTLVAEKLLNNEDFTVDEKVALLLTGTILLDTVNLSPQAGRATPKDEEIITQLGKLLPDLDREGLYKKLEAAKFDISSLSTPDMLRKDMKLVTTEAATVPISMVTMDIKDFLSRPNVEKDLAEFGTTHYAVVVAVMTASIKENGDIQRQLALYSVDDKWREKLAGALKSATDPNLGLSDMQSGISTIVAFSQENVKATRKKILPIIKSYLQSEAVTSQSANANANNSVDLFGDLSNTKATSGGEVSNEFDIFATTAAANDAPPKGSSNEDPFAMFDTLSPTNIPQSTGQTNLDIFGDMNIQGDQKTVPSDSLAGLDVFASPSMQTNPPITQSNMDAFDPFGDLESLAQSSSTATGNDVTQTGSDVTKSGSDVTSGLGDFDPFASFGDITNEPLVPAVNVTATDPSQPIIDPFGGVPDNGPSQQGVSYPATPPNSNISPHDGSVIAQHETLLPSFNSSEMVEKIKQKKALLDDAIDQTPDESDTFPYTPKNSFAESHMETYAREHNLPSFNSSEMVQKIMDKKASLPDLQDSLSESVTPNSQDSLDHLVSGGSSEQPSSKEDSLGPTPFTPQNSFVDANFDKYAKDHQLPSFNSAEMVQ
ncbi:unnamed protein product, partial [Owenia fusiformis]